MIVELLSFDGCPQVRPLTNRLRELLADAAPTAELRLIRIDSDEQAQAERFLGSPTVRVDGRDVDPGTLGRRDYGLKCRIYRSEHGQSATPPEDWIAAALGADAPS